MVYCYRNNKFISHQFIIENYCDGAKLLKIIDASITYGESLHVDLQEQLDANENLQVSYHRSGITGYLRHAPEFETV